MHNKLMMLVVVGLVSTSLYGANYSQSAPRLTANVKTNTYNTNPNARPQPKNPPISNVANEPQTVIAGFVKAWNAHDAKAMAGFWMEDGDLLDPWGRMSAGKRQVERAFTSDQTGRFKDSTVSMTIDGVRFLGDFAIVDTSGKVTNIKGSEGMNHLDHHVFWVMQKQNGTWKVVSARPYQLLPKPAAG